MKNGKIAVSVIMPIYNVENYLRESLESAVNQTLTNIEILCVDDGSTDSSGTIIEEYAEKDRRIKVIHKANTGYGNSMNVGLKMASGKYISILEPDDFISLNMLSELYEIAEKEKADIVKSDFAYLEGKQGDYQICPVRIHEDDKLYGKVLSVEEKKRLFKGNVAHWTCLYRKDFLLLHQIHYNETPGASYQDTGFWFQTLVHAERIYVTDQYYYHYRQDNPNSSMLSKAKAHCISDEYDFIFRKLQEDGQILKEYLPMYILCRYGSHRDTLDRIAEEYQSEFIARMSHDFWLLHKDGLLDTSFMEEQDADTLRTVMNAPAAYDESRQAAARQLHQLLERYRVLYIYGAGYMGRKVLRQLSHKDREKVQGFLVTKRDNGIHKVDGVPVEEFGAWCGGTEDVGIIVGVTRKYREEIVNFLRRNAMHTIIELPDEVNLV